MNAKKSRIEPGEKYKIFFEKDNPNNQSIQIRSIIDEDQVVYKKLSKEKQSLSYHIGSVYYFELLQAGGVIKKAGGDKMLSSVIKATTFAGNEPFPLMMGGFIKANHWCDIRVGEAHVAFWGLLKFDNKKTRKAGAVAVTD